MKPPRIFKYTNTVSFSFCIACTKWLRSHKNIFYHEGRQWNLCRLDYADYWENTDVLLPDYKEY